MSDFIEHIETLKEDLDDIILYLENSGKPSDLVYQIREELDDRDPFIKVNALVAAQLLIKNNRVIH